MTSKHLAILKAKSGELEALSELKKSTTRTLLPLFEVTKIGASIRDAARFKDCSDLTQAYLDETAERIASVWKGRPALADAFHWAADSATTSGDHVVPYLYGKLESLGVKVVPVFGYDRWESRAYRTALKNLGLGSDGWCLRFDSHALEDAAEPEYFREKIQQMLSDIDLEPSEGLALLDFGDITAVSVEQLVEQLTRCMEVLAPFGFGSVATAGCSLPATIDKAVRKPNTVGKVPRKEWLLWQTLRTEYPEWNAFFGDYGVRGPNTADDIISPHTNGKIRYTIGSSYVIFRGHSLQEGEKGAQMYDLARKLANSTHFMGEEFSWGDKQVGECSREKFKGNPTKWIAIDTSHHLAWVAAELLEFEAQTALSR